MNEETKNLEQNQDNEQKFDISPINEALGSQFEDLSSLKEMFTKNGELGSQVETLSGTLKNKETAYGELEGKYNNVLSHFTGEDMINKLYGSEDNWRRTQLGMKFADKDPNVVSQVYNSDLNSFSDIDAILLADKLSMGDVGLSDADRKRVLIEDYAGPDADLSELEPGQKYKLARAARDARQQLQEIKDFSPEQPQFDWLEEARQLNSSLSEKHKAQEDGWKKATDSALSSFEGVKVFGKEGDKDVELFSYEADEKFREQIAPTIVQDFVNQGLDVSKEENVKLINDYIQNAFKAEYFDKAIKKAIEQSSIKKEDELHKEIHSDKDRNDKEAPPSNNEPVGMGLLEYRRSKKK
jgi:hypothetical protein